MKCSGPEYIEWPKSFRSPILFGVVEQAASAIDQSLVRRAAGAYGRAIAVADPIRLEFWEARGLTMAQLRLMYLLLAEDCRSVGQLAEEMRVRPASVTGLTDRLVDHGLIERRADPADRRLVRVALTPEGRRVLGEIEVASLAYLGGIFERMGEESVERLCEALEEFGQTARAAGSLVRPPA